MKTISFAIINIVTLLTSLISLEFLTGEYHAIILVSSMILFVISGAFSVFKKDIWDYAHKSKTQSREYLLIIYKTYAALITTFVVLMSILADFVVVDQNFVMFISYVIVYLSLFIPCHILIFKNHLLKQEAPEVLRRC